MRTWSALARSVAGAVAVVLVALPLTGRAGASDAGGERIRSYDVTLDVRRDGSMQVAETIVYDFGGNARHGIERDIDTEQRYDGSRDRRFPVSEIEVSSPTAPGQVQVTESGGRTRLRIGEGDRTITGQHTYRISYLVEAATTRYPDRDELYWNAVGPGWSVPVERATVRVGGAEVTRAACYSGEPGGTEPCASASASGPNATYTGGPLAAGGALTVVAAFPAGSVAAAAPVLTDRLTVRRFLAGTPAIALPVAAVLIGLPLWWLVALVRQRRAWAAATPPVPPTVPTVARGGRHPAGRPRVAGARAADAGRRRGPRPARRLPAALGRGGPGAAAARAAAGGVRRPAAVRGGPRAGAAARACVAGGRGGLRVRRPDVVQHLSPPTRRGLPGRCRPAAAVASPVGRPAAVAAVGAATAGERGKRRRSGWLALIEARAVVRLPYGPGRGRGAD